MLVLRPPRRCCSRSCHLSCVPSFTTVLLCTDCRRPAQRSGRRNRVSRCSALLGGVAPLTNCECMCLNDGGGDVVKAFDGKMQRRDAGCCCSTAADACVLRLCAALLCLSDVLHALTCQSVAACDAYILGLTGFVAALLIAATRSQCRGS